MQFLKYTSGQTDRETDRLIAMLCSPAELYTAIADALYESKSLGVESHTSFSFHHLYHLHDTQTHRQLDAIPSSPR